VRVVLAALVEGARARDAAAMKEHVSEAYSDAQGNDKRAVVGLVALHFLQNQSVHLLTRVAEVSLATDGAAQATAFAALAGVPIESPEALVALRADLYRFDLTLREEGDAWRVVSAQWRPAALADFRPGAAPAAG
jgi:hypothetical protein